MTNLNFQQGNFLETRGLVNVCRGMAPIDLRKKSKKQLSYKNNSEDDQFEPDYHTMKKLKFPINRKRLSKGNWTLHQNRIYLSFLRHNHQSFVDEATRRQERVFCKLSELLNKKRTPDQCRSHHQKLLANLNNSIDDLIAKIEKKIKVQELKQMNIHCKIEEQYISALKLEEEKPKETIQPEVQPPYRNQSQKRLAQNRQVEKIIQREFYRLTTYKRQSTITIQIDAENISSY